MYNKLTANYNKRCIYNYEDGPPEKKLISDGDMFIKQLSEKQMNTKVNLEEQLSSKSQFYKSTEVIPITSYTSGSTNLNEFTSLIKHLNDVENLKSHGLTNEEIKLVLDSEKGEEYLKNKHRNINENILKEQLKSIFDKINRPCDVKNEVTMGGRLQTELILSAKPASIETKLLKFALENKHQNREKLPGPMDQIKDVEKDLLQTLSPVNIKKIRRKARSLGKQINTSDNTIKEPSRKQITLDFTGNSKWDSREPMESKPKEKKLYSCKPQNYYTIRDGQIIKKSEPNEDEIKLTLEEIREIPKFKNYEKGIPSKVLYLKNLANGVGETQLNNILGVFLKDVVSINVMKGRMQGQAFVEFKDEEVAEKALGQCNGVVLKKKPIIIQFGKGKCP